MEVGNSKLLVGAAEGLTLLLQKLMKFVLESGNLNDAIHGYPRTID
jgi:hypothetical protein